MEIINVPALSRWSDYVGGWAIEPQAGAQLRQLVATTDWAAHQAAAPRPAEKRAIGKIALVQLQGLLLKSASSFGGTSTVQVRREIRLAAADPEISGILLVIDSPGGSVAGIDALAADIRQAGKTKPVWAHIEDLGASAAYWVASQASRISAGSATTLVGSIGTIAVVLDESQAYADQGIKTLVFSTGALKGAGTPGAPVTPDQMAYLQDLIDGSQQSFDSAIMAGRGMTAEELGAVRHGGLLIASEAKKAKLIDAIEPLDKTLAAFQQFLTMPNQASRGAKIMDEFFSWLNTRGFEAAALSESQMTTLRQAYRAESIPSEKARPEAGSFEDKLHAVDAENQRIAHIREVTLGALERHRGDLEKCEILKALCASATSDSKTTAMEFDLAMLRQERTLGPIAFGTRCDTPNNLLLEAALAQQFRLPNLEKAYGDQILQRAQTKFKRGLSLQELLYIAAEHNNGYRGSCRDTAALCRAAFRVPQADAGDFGFRAAGPLSTISVAGILANVANKSLATSFMFSEQAWRGIARIKSAPDFKQMSTYRLTGDNKFTLVPPGGEIQHGTLSDLTYTNRVDTYGKMLGIDRRDIVNDDLGAFASATSELGRGAGDSLNDIFWTAWLDDSTFFPTDKSLDNYDDGATDSVLSLAGLENAEAIFRLQTKPDGTPMGVMPTILLVPATLYNRALQLMGSQGLVVGTTAATGPQTNVFYGRYQVVSSVYLDATSATAWYLLADPGNVAAIEAAFLNGMDSPTVEQADFDFDRLGLSMRAWMDFGVSKMEYRAAVKLKGAA